MIKKNLFLLFVSYFFVIQAGIIGYLWGDSRFYILAAINLGVIVMVMGLYYFFNQQPHNANGSSTKLPSKRVTIDEGMDVLSEPIKDNQLETGAPSEEVKEIKKKIIAIDHSQTIRGAFWIRGIFLLLGLIGLLRLLQQFRSFFGYWILIGTSFAYLLLITLLYKGLGLWKKTIWSNFSYILFLLIFLLSVGLSGLDDNAPFKKKSEHLIEQTLFMIDGLHTTVPLTTPNRNSLMVEEKVLQDEVLEVFDLNGTGGLRDETEGNDLITTGNTIIDEKLLEVKKGSGDHVTYLQAITYLLDKHAIPLSENKKYTFTGLPKTSKDYLYMATAADLRLIGNNTNPETKTQCDIYMVFKGLVEQRKVGTTNDIKGDYRTYASKNNVLNGCQKGKLLTQSNL